MRKFFSLFVSISAYTFAWCSDAVDLGEGLSYFRVHALPADQKAVADLLLAKKSTVLDMRYSSATADSINEFRQALATHTGNEPLLILVSSATPAAIADALSAAATKFVTLGVKNATPMPMVVVAQPADVDRRAYDALESGLPLNDLISGKIEKERYDEAALVKEFNSGHVEAESPPDTDPTTAKTSAPAKEKAPALTDKVLQRAVHLQRALLAIKPRG